MNQPELPLSHRNDPATSHKAEAKHVESGRLAGNRARVLALVCRWPGQTCQELFERCVWCHEASRIMDIRPGNTGFHYAKDVYRYALLRETIKKRMRDLFELDLVERRRDDAGKWLTRNGALCYWPTSRGVLENGGKL